VDRFPKSFHRLIHKKILHVYHKDFYLTRNMLLHYQVRMTSEWGCVNERRRREDQGAAGAEGVGARKGAILSLGKGSGEGAVPLPNFFLNF